jgi:cell division septum initiation protein DivIVA
MSNGGELFAVREDATSRPSFEPALRGYDKRQVDQYVAWADSEIPRLVAESQRAFARIQDMAAQHQRLQVELNELRQRPAQVDRASFRDLGPMVDQILALAEKQADAITSTTAERAAKRQAEAENVLVEAREKAAQTLREFEAEMSTRRAEEDKAHEERRTAAQAELAEIRKQADRLRAEGEAARDRADQEAKRLKEQSAQQVEHARAESVALVEAALAQAQREADAARTQAQQELAQRQAELEQEIDERRTEAGQKIVALHTEAQQHAADVRRRADEQSAAHQQQLAVVQQEIQAQRQALGELQAELDSAQQRLAQSRQEQAATDHEVTQLRQRLGEIRQDLTAELNRLDETRRAADAAEQHAKEVRARVQREAKRVADLAAAAVMAAAAGGADTGEYPQVPVRPRVRRPVDEDMEPTVGDIAPDPQAPTSDNGHARPDSGRMVLAQRESQPEKAATDSE